jgi:mannitol-specific phosphotransferase system IIBC component
VFKEFAKSNLPDKVHQALIKGVYKDQIIGHIVKDSVPLEVQERPLKKSSAKSRSKLKGVEKHKRKKTGELNRRQKQLQENDLNKMVQELPNICDKGMKKSAQGYTTIWKGYKLHAAVDDQCIPLAVIVTSASLND